jgi:cytohesin
MVAFAKRYMECNAGKFSHEDTCYILAFSTIMLNTGVHNPAVKNKQV